MSAAIHCFDRACRVQRMRSAEANSLRSGGANGLGDCREGRAAIAGRKRVRPGRVGIHYGHELGLRKLRQGLGMKRAYFAAANKSGLHRESIGKYCRFMRCRNSRDSRISSMPFTPSSMLTQPR